MLMIHKNEQFQDLMRTYLHLSGARI